MHLKHINLPKISEKRKNLILDILFLGLGCFIYSASVSIFTAPNKIAPGGVTGIATILYYTIGTPIGVMILVLNIPLFLLGFKFIGGKFIVKTLICTAITSVAVDALWFLPKYQGNMILVSLYGGVLSGIGLGLIFIRGATTGGTDVASRLLKLKWPHVPMGRMMMCLDGIIILASIIAFKSVDSGLYAMINLFVSSKVIDTLLYGSDTGKMVLVISDKYDEIAQKIVSELDRGVTLLKGRGYYTGSEREVLMCALRRPQAARIRAIVRKIDPSAFIIMCEAGDVIGEGFKPITKEY